MRRTLQLCWLLGICVVSRSAAADEPKKEEAAAATGTKSQEASPPAADGTLAAPAAPGAAAEPKEGWQTVITGYFRAPIMVGLSSRPDPGNQAGPESMQMVFGPNRVLDGGYYSFGYTRLQEGDWGEIYVTEKRKHVAATIAFMGWWYPWAGYQRPDSSMSPSQGWVTLDSDFELGGLKPNIELKAGVFRQVWGAFGKYDTYMYGRFHQAGEALQVKVPLNADLELRVMHGIGTARNGVFSYVGAATPGYSPATSLTMLHYAHAGIKYQKMLDVGLYYNHSWTNDPTVFTGPDPAGGPYSRAKDANMSVVGADVKLNVPIAGKLWLAPAYVSVKNGWALAEGVELMHSGGGKGIASNYLGWGSTSTPGSTGSGSMFNLGFLYENSLSNVGLQKQGVLPDLTLNVFGMMANANRDLPERATGPDKLQQFKWGADLTLQTLSWLAFMLRYDGVNLDTSNDGYDFSVFTPRVIFSSHFLSNENIWIQYSRYWYGNKMLLATSPTQAYTTPDNDVIKIQANMAW